MRCPFCGTDDDKVIDSRASSDGYAIRRRRECVPCGRRFTTYERIEERPLRVIKKDGHREALDRRKILFGLIKACEKRPIPIATQIMRRAAIGIRIGRFGRACVSGRLDSNSTSTAGDGERSL